MKLSIIHPTARVKPSFQNPWWKSAQRAFETCDRPEDIEYIVIVHQSRILQYLSVPLPFGKFTVVVNYGRDCLVDQCNAGMLAAQGEIWLGNQDDMRYPPHWDSEIRKLIPDTSQRICIASNDNSARPDIIVQSIVTRTLQEAIGPICPEYDGMFIDNEWAIKARQLGAVIPAPHLHFDHLHPVHKTAEMDEVYALENREEAYRRGLEVFERRRAAGFPRVNLPGWTKVQKERIVALCTPGEHHCYDWERQYTALTFALANAGWTVRSYFGYTTNVFHTRMGMTRSVFIDSEKTGQEPELVLWIDDDNIPSIPAIWELMATLDAHPEYSGAVAWCWIKYRNAAGEIVWMPSCGNFKPGTLYLMATKLSDLYADEGAPKKIEWSGFPTALIRFEAVKQLGPKAFLPIFTGENEFGMTGEDVPWFVRAAEAGLQFCVCPRAKVEHLKFHEIEPDYEVGPNADPQRAKLVEQDRERHNGVRVETTPRVKELMEASM